jgi:hypothetical protein
MDLLVSKKDLNEVEKKLSFFGWFTQKIDDYDQKYYREWAHEIPPMQQASRGTIADIHHNLLPPISGRAPDIKTFIREPHQTEDGLYTLSQHAMILHSIVHLFFNEDFKNGFRDLSDLNIMFSEIDQQSDFWSNIYQLAIDSSFENELFYAVRYCQIINGTVFPGYFVANISKFSPTKMRLVISDFIFINVLRPTHPSLSNLKTQIANLFAVTRGHFLKMPLHILMAHSFHKFNDHIRKMMLNEHKDKQCSIQDLNDNTK